MLPSAKKRIVLSYKKGEKPNEEANSQSSQQAREEDLQKLVGDGGNNACSSSMAGGEVKVNSLSSLSETRSV